MRYVIHIEESVDAVIVNYILPNRNRFMLDIGSIEIFVHREMLFHRDVFRSTCDVLFRKINIDIL